MMRLDKVISSVGYWSRKEIKETCKKGRITVNGVVVTDSSVKIDETADVIAVDGEILSYQKYHYFMLNKPQGYVSSTCDNQDTVLDLLNEPYRDLFPVGRLDKDTEGLLLITDDGPLAHQLLSPKKHVEKEYEVVLAKPLDTKHKEKIEAGITIDHNEVCKPCTIQQTDETHCNIILTEGKFHEVKRMFATVGNEVISLKRIRMKHLLLDNQLKPGEYRELREEEVNDLKAIESSN